MTESNELTRPIIGIENRSAQEVFDIMCDRISAASKVRAIREGDGEVKPVDPNSWEGAFARLTGADNLEAGAGDLVERLLTDAAYLGIKNGSLPVIGRDCAEAAAHLAAVTAENARLREALEPFAEAADSTDANDDYSSASIWEHPCALDITIGHLRAARRARAALSQEAPK